MHKYGGWLPVLGLGYSFMALRWLPHGQVHIITHVLGSIRALVAVKRDYANNAALPSASAAGRGTLGIAAGCLHASAAGAWAEVENVMRSSLGL